MKIETRKKGNITIFDISGRMLLQNAHALPERFYPLVEEGAREFVFDLSRVTDTATDGVNAVVSCRNKVVKRDGVIKLVLNERLRGIYTTLFLDTIIELYDDVEEALASFAS